MSEDQGERFHQPERDYEVGRGKPPKHSRFKPGQSGNPRGRPKGAVNCETALMNAVNSMVVINEDGRKKRYSKLEVIFMQAANKAAKGDTRAAEMLLRQLQRYEPPTSPTLDQAMDDNAAHGAPEDQAVFDAMINRFKGEG